MASRWKQIIPKFTGLRIDFQYIGGYNAILATLSLFEEAAKSSFDRYMILQGADYPLYSNSFINEFFEKNKDIEFIRAVDESIGDKREWYRYVPYNSLDEPNLLKRIKNKLNAEYWRSSIPKLRKNCFVQYDGNRHHIFRGWGHFAVTDNCVKYVLYFSKNHPEFNDFFKHVYAPDESYFHTIIFNSEFAKNTVNGKPIDEKDRCLEKLLNLTYFEYPSMVREFTKASEYEYLMQKGFLFFRKASSESEELLNRIDQANWEDVIDRNEQNSMYHNSL